MSRPVNLAIAATITVALYLGLDSITFDVQLNGQQATGFDRASLITLAGLMLFAVCAPVVAVIAAPAVYGAELARRIGAKLHIGSRG